MQIFYRTCYPAIIALIRNYFYIKFQFTVKSFFVGNAITINEITRFTDAIAVLSEKPLVYFHLPFVTYLPVGVQCNFFGFGGGFVVNDMKLPIGIYPNIVNSSGYK